ncbi:hypothetical protein GCM10012275_00190 [Longimycelium tulufanense]|uniref:DUF397 domain-containing protein n=1 Tax=Longimycelium tulufanense TaxID=907463 RepID=A0A8J3C5R9_9PSEU|nr:DUF397 domain-containing protein [Longimycelium tulufanense]GGM32754.1 hypothetical protein GCM10012275_00190 [Longimycelium tulufanense]
MTPEGTRWRKASTSLNDACVEVAALRHRIGIRDSKNPTGPVLTIDRSPWLGLLSAIKSGRLPRTSPDA